MSNPPPADPNAPDSGRCPLCDQPNRCAMEVQRETGMAQPPCWCTGVTFDAALLARVPQQAQRKACICQACATATPPTR